VEGMGDCSFLHGRASAGFSSVNTIPALDSLPISHIEMILRKLDPLSRERCRRAEKNDLDDRGNIVRRRWPRGLAGDLHAERTEIDERALMPPAIRK
jgi:hypothetical protein